METDLAARLRAICLPLPEVTERPSHGAPTFFVRDKKSFVTLELCQDAYRAVAPARLIAGTNGRVATIGPRFRHMATRARRQLAQDVPALAAARLLADSPPPDRQSRSDGLSPMKLLLQISI